MTMTTDRSIPGRIEVQFSRSRTNGALVRSPVWSGKLDPDGLPVSVGTGINVSAMGTLAPEEARALAALLVEEAAAIESGAVEPRASRGPRTFEELKAQEEAEDERWKRAGQEYAKREGRDKP